MLYPKNEKILLVDDEADFLDVVKEFLSEDEGYSVTTALSGNEALQILEHEKFDLLISDINMPQMKGFELLYEASKRYPQLKTALITAYDVHDYMYMAKHYNIGNIITKTTPFNFSELAILVRNILTGDVFGLDRYLHNATIKSAIVKSTTEIESTIQLVTNDFNNSSSQRKFRQALGEILTNAVYYGALSERGDNKIKWPIDVSLKPQEQIVVSWGTDTEKSAVAVRDQKGRLSKKEVLFWLERNTTKNEKGFAIGLLDEHGKGLFITQETIDRLIINIARDKITEIIMINYFDNKYSGHRPLWIQEV